MTETLARPAASQDPTGRTPDRPRPLIVSAGVAAALGLLLMAFPVLTAWTAEPRSGASTGAALRTVGQLWLLAHGGSLTVPGGRVALVPLGLTLLPLLLLARAGRSVAGARRHATGGAVPGTSGRAAAVVAVAVAVAYAALTGLVTVLARTSEVVPGAWSAVLGALVVALLGAGGGALRAHRPDAADERRPRTQARRRMAAAASACALLAAGGALLVAGSLAVHGSRAADLAAATEPGPVGGAGLLLLGLGLAPNAVVWATSWLAGPGFAVGVGTAVGPFGHELGAVPAVPLLAALPTSGVPAWVGALALLLPVAAGAAAGRVLARTGPPVRRRGRALDVLVTGAACGLVWAVLAHLAGGAVGDARLAELGPSPWRTGLAIAAEVALGAAAALLVLRRGGRAGSERA